jgi:hypothetical protein
MKLLLKLSLFLFVFTGLNNTIKAQNKTAAIPAENEIKCTSKESKNPEADDPIIITTCLWSNYKFVATGTPDYKGRYSYDYEVFLIGRGKAKKISNSELFNDKLSQLEKLLNQKIKSVFDDYAQTLETSDCLQGLEFTEKRINEMGISLYADNKINFHVSFGLGGACMNVDGATVTFEMSEIKEYFRCF